MIIIDIIILSCTILHSYLSNLSYIIIMRSFVQILHCVVADIEQCDAVQRVPCSRVIGNFTVYVPYYFVHCNITVHAVYFCNYMYVYM
jgi:hypothetical protein